MRVPGMSELDIGEARISAPVDLVQRREMACLAQQCMETAARLVVLASRLCPDMPGVHAPGVGSVMPIRAAIDEAFKNQPKEHR